MAMNYQNFASLGVNLNRQKYGPLDISNVFTSAADLKYYLTKGTFTEGVSTYWYKNANEKIVPYPYEGQVLATVIDGVVSVYALSLDTEGNFQTQEIGAKIETDDKTIRLVNGKLELVGLPTDTAGKTYVPSYVNGVLTWAEPDTSTAEGQQQAIDGLTTSVAGLGEILNGKAESEEGAGDAVVGLVDRVEALEAVDNATQAELDAYKEVVTAAIGEALQAAKDYADENDANTVYDDTALAGRVSAIEADYLKAADKYDDSVLAGKVGANEEAIADLEEAVDGVSDAVVDEKERAEAAEAELLEKINAIDFIDADELATELAPYAKTEDVTTALAGKADKTALEALQNTVDAFLTGEGTEKALDSLKELIAYIDEHDGADLTELFATVEGIENKLVGIDTTVAAYVTAAIDALKIGDYAKAADLTTLAGRVEALEGKPFDTYATKTEVQGVDAKFADYTTTKDLTDLLADKADADSVVDNDTFEAFKSTNTTAINDAKDAAVAAAKTETETQVGALEDAVAETYATKDELTEAVEGIENDLAAYAKTADVEAELANKANASNVYTKTEIDTKIGTPGVPAVVDEDGNEVTPAVQGTGVFANAYSRAEIDKLLDEVQGGSSASADSVLRQLNTYKSTNDERVSAIETKNGEQDTAIATAKSQADKGVADAAKVAGDLAALDARVVSNTNEIAAVAGTITTVNETLSGEVAALKAKDIELAGLITGLDTSVKGHSETLGQHTASITALENKDAELAAAIQANTDKFAGYSTTEQVNKAIDDKIAAIPAVDFTGYATETYVTDAIAVVNGEVAKKANADDVYTIAQADAKFMTEAQVKSAMDKVVADVSDTDTIEGLVTLVEYVHDNAGDIAKLVSDVENNGKAIVKNAEDIAKNASDIVAINEAIAAIVQPKASEEVTVADNGTLGLGKVSTDKLVQGADTLVLNGGSAL